MNADLNNHRRDTLLKIFSYPRSGNLEWREVLSLLEVVGTVYDEHNGKLKVTVGPETETGGPPKGKDVDVQTIVDLCRMLREAGPSPQGPQPTRDERSRDHGDGRSGAPTQLSWVTACNSPAQCATEPRPSKLRCV